MPFTTTINTINLNTVLPGPMDEDGFALISTDDVYNIYYNRRTNSYRKERKEPVEVLDDKYKKGKPGLLKELEMDLQDLLLHLFKGEPRIVEAGHFNYERIAPGQRHYERDNALARGQYTIYYKYKPIGVITCKPHKKLKLVAVPREKPRIWYAQSLLIRLMYDLVPEAKVEGRTK